MAKKRGPNYIHENSILAQARYSKDKTVLARIFRGQKAADIEMVLMNKWARSGFVSVPGGYIGLNRGEDEGSMLNG